MTRAATSPSSAILRIGLSEECREGQKEISEMEQKRRRSIKKNGITDVDEGGREERVEEEWDEERTEGEKG